MLIKKEFVNKLRDFGLNSYESKIWTALLSRGISTAGELSDIANVPRSRSYDVLESLEKKGFIIMKIGKPIKYIAVNPSEVLERVKKKIKQESEQKQEVIDKIKESDVLKELTLLHNKGVDLVEPSDLSGSFKGRDSIYNQIESMLNNAQKSIILMTTEDGLNRKAKILKKSINKNKDKNLDVKIIAPITEKNKEAYEQLKNFVNIKNKNGTKARFVATDDKELMFMLTDDKGTNPSYDSAVWISSDFFTKSFVDLFNSVWKK
jgi:HTH-type transcriptional regulator, sugar sensing transcriptional regulator